MIIILAVDPYPPGHVVSVLITVCLESRVYRKIYKSFCHSLNSSWVCCVMMEKALLWLPPIAFKSRKKQPETGAKIRF